MLSALQATLQTRAGRLLTAGDVLNTLPVHELRRRLGGWRVIPVARRARRQGRAARGLATRARRRPSNAHPPVTLSLIHISEPTRQEAISYAVFCL